MTNGHNRVEWHTQLVAELLIAPGIAAELSRQLVSKALAQSGVALDDDQHAFLSDIHGFTVQYHGVGESAVATVAGYLVGPDAMGHDAIAAWRSKTGADLNLTSERDAADLEFFWLSLPVDELRHPERVDASDWLRQNRFGFAVDIELYKLDDIYLRFIARTMFSDNDVDMMVSVIGTAIEAWNERGLGAVHYCSGPEIDGDRHMVRFFIDLGGSQLDAVAEILRAVDLSPLGAAIGRCSINFSK